MTQNINKKSDFNCSGHSSRIIGVLFIILLLFMGAGTFAHIALIYKARRAEFGAGHSMLGRAIKQEKNKNANNQDHQDNIAVNAQEVISSEGQQNDWVSRLEHSRLNSLFKRIKNYTAVIDRQWSLKLFGSEFFVDHYGQMGRFIGKKTITTAHNYILRTKNNFLYKVLSPFDYPYPDAHTKIDPSFQKLKTFLDKRKIKFLCMVTLLNEYGFAYSRTDEEYKEKNGLNKLYEELDSSGISYFDCFSELKKGESDKTNWFYRTDHHWRIESVFKLMPALVQRLKDETKLEISNPDMFYQEQNFQVQTFPEFFLGSFGRETGKYFAPPDDFTYYIPNFPTDFEVDITIGRSKIHREGSFQDSIVFYDKQIKPKNVWNNRYAVYWGYDFSECDVINKNVQQGRILAVIDSSSLPVTAFLSLVFRQIKMLDFRYRTPDAPAIEQVIEEYQPDIVLVIQNLSFYQDNISGPHNRHKD